MKKIILLFCLCSTLSCTNDSEDDLIPNTPTTASQEEDDVLYSTSISSIINNNCIACHNSPPTNAAISVYNSYSTVKNASSIIFNRISRNTGESGLMPQGGPRLAQAQIDLFEEWINDGLQE